MKSDPFAAVAEPRRRRMLEALAQGERPVNALAGSLGWPQPMVSKHLAVLKEAGLVSMRREGRRRLYRVEGRALKPVHEWVKTFERSWDDQLERIRERAEHKAREQNQSKAKRKIQKEK